MKLLNKLIKLLFKSNRSSGTVRYMFPAMIGIAALMGAAVITSDEFSYIRLSTSQTAIAENDRFAIDVYAFAHEPVNAVDITLQFEPDSVEVLEVDRGQSVITIWTQDPIIENDKVILRGGTFRRGFIGEHKIATVELKAIKLGNNTLKAEDVILLAGDGLGTPVSTNDAGNSMVNLYVYDKDTNPDGIDVNIEVRIVTDIDGDGEVTLKDISAFMASWSKRDFAYDFNGDGRMTFRDFSILLGDFFLRR